MLANGFQNGQHVLWAAIFHQRSGVGHTFEHNLHRHPAARTKLLFNIVGEQHAGSATTG